ncbi:MAG: sulfotransferase domain-containing protein [Bacteroidia bacterium]|nr:sulfotransferase domain-containing protein [Bacteroidia bacterium]
MNRPWRKIQYPFIKALSAFKTFNPVENLLIFSEPRGGSTWLSQMINTIPKTTLIWEPINPKVYQKLRNIKFGWRQFIPEDESWDEAHIFFLKILSGKKLTYHTTSHLNISSYVDAERLIVKFCRGNALLPWITKRFNFKYKPIYLVRHPFAVVSSQLKHGAWKEKKSNFEIPDTPFSQIYQDHRSFLKAIGSVEGNLIATWCLANKYTLENPRNNQDWITVFYEDLVGNPRNEIDRIFKAWNIEVPHEIFKKIKEPSATVKNDNFSRDIEQQLSKWKEEISKKEHDKMSEVLNYFNIQYYNNESIFPLK